MCVSKKRQYKGTKRVYRFHGHECNGCIYNEKIKKEIDSRYQDKDIPNVKFTTNQNKKDT
jgi:hypothetical protein